MNKNIVPVRIVSYSLGVSHPESLLKEKEVQIGLNDQDVTTITGPAYIILDFGKEYSGYLRILNKANSDTSKLIRIRLGESVSETCAEIGEKNATNDHATRDMNVNIPYYSDQIFGPSGFRFARIDVSENQTLVIKSILLKEEMDDREEAGYFKCDDEMINTIWNTASRTIRLCLQNGYFFDGIKRDRLVWIGDLYPETKASLCLYNEVPEILNSLKFATIQDPLPGWINFMPTYSFWWVIILEEAYHASLDKELIRPYLDYFKGVINQVKDVVNDDGTLDLSMYFIDWPSHYDNDTDMTKYNDERAGCESLAIIMFNKAIKLAEEFNLIDVIKTSKECLEKLNKKKHFIRKYKQHSAISTFSGELSKINEEVLLRDGAKGMSTFMSYFILDSICQYGHYDEALSIMKEYYGAMIKVGATTFWEDFDISWTENCFDIFEMPIEGKKDIHGDYGAFCYKGFRHSFCHGWSSGVIPYLVEDVAGLKKVEGYEEKYIFDPHMSYLKNIKCGYPTKYGLIKIELSYDSNGTLIKNIDAPKEIEIISK